MSTLRPPSMRSNASVSTDMRLLGMWKDARLEESRAITKLEGFAAISAEFTGDGMQLLLPSGTSFPEEFERRSLTNLTRNRSMITKSITRHATVPLYDEGAEESAGQTEPAGHVIGLAVPKGQYDPSGHGSIVLESGQ